MSELLLYTSDDGQTRLHLRVESETIWRGKAATNFELTLPKPQSDLARESLKDPYRFDFLGLTNEAQERTVGQPASIQ